MAVVVLATCGGALLRQTTTVAPPQVTPAGARSLDLGRRFAARSAGRVAEPLATNLSDPLMHPQPEPYTPSSLRLADLRGPGAWHFCDLDMETTRLGPAQDDARFTPDSQVSDPRVIWGLDTFVFRSSSRDGEPGRGTIAFPAPVTMRVHVEWDGSGKCQGTVEGLHVVDVVVLGLVEGTEARLLGCGFDPSYFEARYLGDDGTYRLELSRGTECQLSVAVENGYSVAVGVPVEVKVEGDMQLDLTAPDPPEHERVPVVWYIARAWEYADALAELAGITREAAERRGDAHFDDTIEWLEAEEQATREYIDRLERTDTDVP